jgi:serine/threonine protein kinase
VLYQVYFVLPLIPGFSHNDLHYENVILTPNEKYYQYVYTKNGIPFFFQCRYAAKIIDYGRCIYPGTNLIREELTKYTDDAQRQSGYPWKHVGYDPCPTVDLMLLKVCMDYEVLDPSFFETMKKIMVGELKYTIPKDSECNGLVYSKLTSPVLRQFRKGVPDMHDVVTQLEQLISREPRTPTPWCTIHVSDVALMRVDWPHAAQAAGTRRKRKRKSRRVRR